METGPDIRAQELLEKGAGLYEEGKLYEALSCWKQVLQLDPGNEIAAEYLRFIEDNFQIGVDAFIEHHNPSSAPPAAPTPPPRAVQHGPPPLPPEESIEELDWSEILDTSGSSVPARGRAAPEPEPGNGEDFFSDLQPGSLAPSPGGEAEAWGAPGSADLSGGSLQPGDSAELMPEVDPLVAPTDQFTAPYRPPSGSDHGSVSQEILPGDPRSRRNSGVVASVRGSAVSGRGLAGRDISEMSEESIEMLLDQDFRAWEEGSDALARPAGGEDADLEAMLSQGLGQPVPPPANLPPPPALDLPPPPSTAPLSTESPPTAKIARGTGARPRPPPLPPKKTPASPPPRGPRVSAPSPAVAGAPPAGDLEAFLRAGMADLDRIESGGEPNPPPRQLIKAPRPGTDLDGLMREARRKQQAGDFSGSLVLVEEVLSGDPDHVEARRYLEENTTRLLGMYRSRLANMQKRPRVKLRPQEVIWQSLDHRAGFLLSQVDGRTSYEDIIEISGMPILEATRILARLVEHGVIG